MKSDGEAGVKDYSKGEETDTGRGESDGKSEERQVSTSKTHS